MKVSGSAFASTKWFSHNLFTIGPRLEIPAKIAGGSPAPESIQREQTQTGRPLLLTESVIFVTI